jgi:hypothetical protein
MSSFTANERAWLSWLTVDVYQKMAKIAGHQVNVRMVVGKSVAAGIILINQ